MRAGRTRGADRLAIKSSLTTLLRPVHSASQSERFKTRESSIGMTFVIRGDRFEVERRVGSELHLGQDGRLPLRHLDILHVDETRAKSRKQKVECAFSSCATTGVTCGGVREGALRAPRATMELTDTNLAWHEPALLSSPAPAPALLATTEHVPLDPTVLNALSNARDRFLLLRAEQEMERFLADTTSVPPPSFLTTLYSHRVMQQDDSAPLDAALLSSSTQFVPTLAHPSPLRDLWLHSSSRIPPKLSEPPSQPPYGHHHRQRTKYQTVSITHYALRRRSLCDSQSTGQARSPRTRSDRPRDQGDYSTDRFHYPFSSRNRSFHPADSPARPPVLQDPPPLFPSLLLLRFVVCSR